MGFLDDLLGVKNIVGADGIIMPRRHALRFEGEIQVSDDPVNQLTRVHLGANAGGLVHELVEVSEYLGTDAVLAADVLRIGADVDGTIIGIRHDGIVKRKTLLNVGSGRITLSATGEAPSGTTFVLPDGIDIALVRGAAVDIVWEPGSAEQDGGWHVV